MDHFKKSWERGDKARIAKEVGISPQHLSDILADRSPCHPMLAVKLERASKRRRYNINRIEWAFPSFRAGNPLFRGATRS